MSVSVVNNEFLQHVTPVVITYNEAPNIQRTLEQLSWANDIVVVDSFSSDSTETLACAFSQVRFFKREFDQHANQWNFAIHATDIQTDWVLTLDADYVLSDALVDELRELQVGASNGFFTSFVYCVDGKSIRSGVYPRVLTLFKRNNASYVQDGHTQRVQVKEPVGELKAPIFHDDRKSYRVWLEAQKRYMKLEAELIFSTSWSELKMSQKVRRLIVVSPIAIVAYCLLVRGGMFDGKAGLAYAWQRFVAELILSKTLLGKLL